MFYSPQIKNHFENPHNGGTLENPCVSVTLGSPKEKVIIRLQLKIVKDKIIDAKFLAYGIVAIACMSYLTESIKDKTLDAAIHMESMTLAQELNVPSFMLHNCFLSIDALQTAIFKYRGTELKS